MGGYTQLHSELEGRLAELKSKEDCLLFPTGFAANLAVLTALCSNAGAAIFSDELNHASIIDGARLAARNKVWVFSGKHKLHHLCSCVGLVHVVFVHSTLEILGCFAGPGACIPA